MVRRPAELASLQRGSLEQRAGEDRWDELAQRLLDSLASGPPTDLDPELEVFLRQLIGAKARRWRRQLEARGLGVDPEDIAQRVLLRLLDSPPNQDADARPIRRLIAWVNTVTHNYLCDLVERRVERLVHPARGEDGEAFEAADRHSGVAENRYAARHALVKIRPLLAREYPAGLALFDLLLGAPQATSLELAEMLQTTPSNVDQMRCRMRRVLRRYLGDAQDTSRRNRQ